MHSFKPENTVFEDLVPGCSKVNVTGGIWGPVNKKPGFSIPVLIFDPGIDILCIPKFLDRKLNIPGIKIAGNLSHDFSSKNSVNNLPQWHIGVS